MPFAGEIHYRGSASRDQERYALILLHGAGGSYLYWPPEIRHMPGRGILAIDLPGHGESSGDDVQSIEAHVLAMLDFLDNLGINQAVLAGHSMGSAIAQRMSLDHPDRIKGLILVGAGAKLRVNPQLIEYCRSEETYPEAVSQVVEWSFSQQADQKLVRLAEERMKAVSPSVLLTDFKACNEFDIRERVGYIKQPTLIICGEDDQMTPVRFSEYLAEKIRGSKLEVIPDAGHMVMLEQPQRVNRAIEEFLQTTVA